MILISHRGNINGEDPVNENKPSYILKAIESGYDVEVDLRKVNGKWFLGHDEAEYEVDTNFILNERLWCHAKNLEALRGLVELGVKCFWHQKDFYTLTSNGLIWTYPGFPLTESSICVMPELYSSESQNLDICYGICSDVIEKYRKQYG